MVLKLVLKIVWGRENIVLSDYFVKKAEYYF